jgi:rRNA maturation RNase YbeY
LKKTRIRAWITNIAQQEGFTITELNYIFLNDEALLEMNKQFLAHDELTDIITFDNSEIKQKIEGEIYISVDRVKDNAKSFSTKFHVELCRVMIHGLLHLCGYKDKTKAQQTIMRIKENEALAVLAKTDKNQTFHVEQ